MPDPLAQIWAFADTAEPLFSEQLVHSWPDGAFDRLLATGLMRQAASVGWAECPECPDGHREEIVSLRSSNGSLQYFIPCPEHLRVKLAADSLRQWTIDFDRLATLLAKSIETSGQVSAVVPGRLWHLGRVEWKSAKREVLWVRGVQLVDETAKLVVAHLCQRQRAIVFTAETNLQTRVPGECLPAILSLPQIATLFGGDIELDRVALASMLEEADHMAKAEESKTIDSRQLKKLVRTQVTAQQKCALTDDVLVNAYRQENSYRKAAKFLTEQTGQSVLKDKVHRAVQRAGGPAAVLRAENSDSIERPVASQRRDNRGKTFHQAKPVMEK
jgi:hypothetical protein